MEPETITETVIAECLGLEEKDTPEYPRDLGKDVANFRKLSLKFGGIGNLPRMARRGYGNAVLEAIRTAQSGQLRRAAVPISRPNCASRTFEQTGEGILKAIAAQHRAATCAKGRFDQREADVKYEEAMLAKHGANSAAPEFRQAA